MHACGKNFGRIEDKGNLKEGVKLENGGMLRLNLTIAG